MKIFAWFVFALGLAACDSSGSSGSLDGGRPPLEVACSFENCTGCCDGDRCDLTPADESCGNAGEACQVCGSSETCAAGQCVPVADCTECDGCCLNGTQCVPGNSQTACGAGGDACDACGSGTGCDADTGTCQPLACDASNCAGCCTANGVCITSGEQTTDACGAGGQACGVCAPGASACTAGTCIVDQPCLEFCTDGCCTSAGQCIPFAQQDQDACGGAAGPMTCGTCSAQLSCVGGGCVADIAWRVSVVSAVIAPTKAGAAWDGQLFTNPLPDPYAGLSLNNDTFLDGFTPKVDNTLTPNWNHAFGNYVQSEILAQGFTVVVRDSDGLGVFETIGLCTVTVTAQHLAAGFVVQPTCGYASNVRLAFTHP